MVNRERGHTVMELVIATSVLTVLCGAALTGGNAHFAAIGRAHQEMQAAEVAADRIEAIAAADVAPRPGERSFPTPSGLTGTEKIAVVSPGLFEVRVHVIRPGARAAVLTTLVAPGGAK